jgi:hypothetical protein
MRRVGTRRRGRPTVAPVRGLPAAHAPTYAVDEPRGSGAEDAEMTEEESAEWYGSGRDQRLTVHRVPSDVAVVA